jgi:nitroimidazol reductase NimA-like FMN-containing flavoprotein (pyridoxamine 5'-phosphate oxidase superfamily)
MAPPLSSPGLHHPPPPPGLLLALIAVVKRIDEGNGMDDSAKNIIEGMIDAHRIASLATLRPDGWPQVTTVGYVNEGLTIYFLCGRDSQKARNLARDDRVSLTINDDPSDVMKITGLSMAGHAWVVDDLIEGARLIALMPLKYPDRPPLTMPMPTPDQIRIFRIMPSIISVLDYSKGFGHSDLVTV